MKRLVKTLLTVICFGLSVLALVVVISLIYSTAHGYMTWWFRSGGYVAVDGLRSGYLDRNWGNSAVIITRADLRPPQSYLVWLYGKKSLTHCGEWHAPRIPAFSIGDVNPPCSFFSNGSDMPTADNAVFSTLTARPGFVEFHTAHGKKITASW
ncbi:MAG: hypothetical protein JWN74_1013 [Acidobacteriaceae bacterium]|nr:hypothetical protein [Acidobacteriaceae bacterium]